MSDDVNQQLVLRDRPTGVVTDDDFQLVELPVAAPGDGQVLVRTLWLSFEPAQRGWLNDVPSYVRPVAIGEVMRSWGVGQVIASGHPRFEAGQLVHGTLHWQTHALVDLTVETNPPTELAPIPPEVGDSKLMLSVAGITGMTAYFGMRFVGAARVIGTAGSADKRAWVQAVAGFDDCVDHYDEKVRRRLREAAPNGYNVVFDNVGGALLDAALLFAVAAVPNADTLSRRTVSDGAYETATSSIRYRP